MSIKILFDSANKNRNYSEYSTEKDLFDFVESAENANVESFVLIKFS